MVLEGLKNFEEQHRSINRLFKEYQDQKNIDTQKAKKLFNKFASDLQRHMLWEERILFPILAKEGHGNYSHAVEVIKNEHKKILQLLKDLYLKISTDKESQTEEENLINALIKHEEFEDDILHPAVNRSSDKKKAFEAINNISEEEFEKYLLSE